MKIEQNGQEIEVFTPDELEAHKTEAVEKFKTDHPELANVDQLKTDLQAAQDELKVLKEDPKNANFTQAREKIATLEKTIGTLQTDITNNNGKAMEFVLNYEKDKMITKIAAGDQELAKKIKYNFEKNLTDVKATTPEEIAKKLELAYKLSSDNPAPDVLSDIVLGSSGASGNQGAANNINPDLKAFGSKYFGLTDEDWAKHGAKYGANK